MAGHDKGKMFIVVKCDKDRVWLSDGKLRTIADPKKKNVKHIQPVKKILLTEDGLTDQEIRKTLKAFAERKHECLKQM